MILVIIDFNRTIYDPDADDLMPGARELLEKLKERAVKTVLVSRLEGNRLDLLQRFGIDHLFADAVFVGGDKTAELFRQIIQKHGAKPEEAFVIGDHLHQEIRAGNVAGAHTIYFKQGAFALLLPQAKHDVAETTVGNLLEALKFIN